MSRRKNESSKGGQAIAKAILEQYQPTTLQEMQEALRDIFGLMVEAMPQGETEGHWGYKKNNREIKGSSNSSMWDIEIRALGNREGSFEPQIIPKRVMDASEIEDRILSMHASGQSQQDIAETIKNTYGFEIPYETISAITVRVTKEAEAWQNRPLKKFYTFLFVDCIYVNIRKDLQTKSSAVYVIMSYDVNGAKDVLGIWIGDSEDKDYRMQIFDEIKGRGVEDILFISMDEVSELEEDAKSIFKDAIVQRCIAHLIRNSIKYIPTKEYRTYIAQLKKVYGAESLEAAEAEFERFKQEWSQYPGAVDVWGRNWAHVEQLFNYGSAVRKVMYTTYSVETLNSDFRKATKNSVFPSEEAVLKVLYLQLYKHATLPVHNWAIVRNQLSMDSGMQARIIRYEKS